MVSPKLNGFSTREILAAEDAFANLCEKYNHTPLTAGEKAAITRAYNRLVAMGVAPVLKEETSQV